MRAKTRDEGGWVLITAAVLMGVMLSIGLVALRLVDSDSHRSRDTRESESALNLDEGVLYAQSLILAQNWPSAANHPGVVPSCDSATSSATTAACPNPANLAGTSSSANFTNVDVESGTSWKTKIRDNDGFLRNAYDPAKADLPQTGSKGTCAGPCNYDFNGDDRVWVQAQTYVRGHPRNVVALMQLETLRESIPRSAVTAGALSVTNNGNHGGTPIINANGSQVIVRCSPDATDCVQAASGQVTPWPPVAGTTTLPPMMTATQLARFKQRAITDGRYYTTCPGQSGQGYDLSGPVVWVEGCSSPSNLTNRVPTTPCAPPSGMSGACVNNSNAGGIVKDDPGILIWHCGRADLSGGWTYRGVLYIVNNSDGTCPANLPQRGNYTCTHQPAVDQQNDVLNTNGGFGVWGAVSVDGPGCLKVGSNNLQINFDNRVFDTIESYGTVGLVQNTWRELPPTTF
jgi:hypothetical protein